MEIKRKDIIVKVIVKEIKKGKQVFNVYKVMFMQILITTEQF